MRKRKVLRLGSNFIRSRGHLREVSQSYVVYLWQYAFTVAVTFTSRPDGSEL